MMVEFPPSAPKRMDIVSVEEDFTLTGSGDDRVNTQSDDR